MLDNRKIGRSCDIKGCLYRNRLDTSINYIFFYTFLRYREYINREYIKEGLSVNSSKKVENCFTINRFLQLASLAGLQV